MSCFNTFTGENNWWWIVILFILLTCNDDNSCINSIRNAVCGDNLFIIIALLLLCNGNCGRDTTRFTDTCGCN